MNKEDIMNKLADMVEAKREQDGLSYERMSRHADMSMGGFRANLGTGIVKGTSYRIIKGFATVLDMKAWELMRILEEEGEIGE